MSGQVVGWALAGTAKFAGDVAKSMGVDWVKSWFYKPSAELDSESLERLKRIYEQQQETATPSPQPLPVQTVNNSYVQLNITAEDIYGTVIPFKPKPKKLIFPTSAPTGISASPVWASPTDWQRAEVMPKSSDYVKLGRLLRNNVIQVDENHPPVELWEWSHGIEPDEYKASMSKSGGNFLSWLVEQTQGAPWAEGGYTDNTPSFWDQAVTVWFESPRSLNGELGFVWGTEPLAHIFFNYWTQSQNSVQGGVRGVAYQDVNVIPKKSPYGRFVEDSLGDIASKATDTGLAGMLKLSLGGEEQGVEVLLVNASLGGASKALGVGQWPLKLPVSLLIENEDLAQLEQEQIEKLAYERVKSLPEYHFWFVKVFDEIMGKFPLNFQIGESDLIDLEEEMKEWEKKEPPQADPSVPWYLQNDKLVQFSWANGRRVKRVKVPNIAEAMSEILSAGMIEDQKNTIITEFVTRILTELGMSRKTDLETHSIAESIMEYLGYEIHEKTIDVPFGWTPNLNAKEEGEYLSKLLAPSTQKVQIVEFVEKLNFQKYLHTLAETHAIIKAAHTEGVGKSALALANKVREFAKAFDEPTVKDGKGNEKNAFDDFLESVEDGFLGKSTMLGDKPYGKPYGERPKIKRVTKPKTPQ